LKWKAFPGQEKYLLGFEKAFFKWQIGTSSFVAVEQALSPMTSMDLGTLVQPCITSYFEQLNLGPHDATVLVQQSHFEAKDALEDPTGDGACLLYCDETMEDGVLELPVLYGKKCLILSDVFRENAGFLSNMDWAELCDKGLKETIANMEECQYRGGVAEAQALPSLDLYDSGEKGFVW